MDDAASTLLDVLVLLAILAALTTAAALATVILVLWRLRRTNRVAAEVPSPAPLHWLVSPGWAARQHRSLCRSARLARAVAGHRDAPLAELAELADDLVRQAVTVDAELAIAARLPAGARWSALGLLARRTATVAAATTRLAGLALPTSRPTGGSATGWAGSEAGRQGRPRHGAEDDLARLDERLRLLVEAHAELDRLDRNPSLAHF